MLSQQRQRKIIIIGGTGKQGSAVINALLPSKSTSSLHLLTLTRNLQSKKALELKEREVELVQKDLNEATVDQLTDVFQGADGLFIAQAISDKEVEQGYKIINAAEKACVKQVVYSSVCRAHDAPNVPHFHSKFLIEEYLKQSSIKYYTILRPFSFMENLFFATRYDKEKVCFFTDPQTTVNHIACEDIGKVADRDTSLTNAKHFATEPTISLALWTSSYHWAKSDKNVICLNNESSKVYYIPTRDLDSIPQKDLNRYKTQKFTTFNQLKKSFDIWCLEVENDSNWRKSKCNCPAFLKNFICKHVVGMGIRLKHCKPPAAAKTVPIGEKRKRGRPSRA
ncbi:unnamed protein product [Adineta steineri]|uniref:NmrA-like family domain-containing protein 1 n=1 Tax=Adineta steineri TaxID=433720 RepID=A0A813VAQ0_9BILA|nr:unnamed protein product [Adineta steineri]